MSDPTNAKREDRPTAENALQISLAFDRALGLMVEARKELGTASDLAKNDYEGNGEALERILGGLSLVIGATAVDLGNWSRYASARRDRKVNES